MATGHAPQLVMISGPNGSGKSTLIGALRADPNIRLPALYVNADDLQRKRGIVDPTRHSSCPGSCTTVRSRSEGT